MSVSCTCPDRKSCGRLKESLDAKCFLISLHSASIRRYFLCLEIVCGYRKAQMTDF